MSSGRSRSRRSPVAERDLPRGEYMPVPYRNRTEAGRFLAEKLAGYARDPDLLVLALPRGGVPVAYEVARALEAPLDVFLVRKLGVPGHEELAMGAIATGGVRLLRGDVVRALRIPARIIHRGPAGRRDGPPPRPPPYPGAPPASGPGWRGAGGGTAPAAIAPTGATGRRPTSGARSSSWSTTGWPRAPACGRPWPPCGRCDRRGSSWPCRSPPPRPARSSTT